MSLLSILGVDESVHRTTEEVQSAVAKTLVELEPLLRDVENRLGGIAHGLLDRFEIEIRIKLNPVPKATAVNPTE